MFGASYGEYPGIIEGFGTGQISYLIIGFLDMYSVIVGNLLSFQSRMI